MSDAKAIQGVWRPVSWVTQGQDVHLGMSSIVFDAGRFREVWPDLPDDGRLRATYRLHPRTNPKRLVLTLDYNGPDGPPDPSPIVEHCWYRLDGDVLSICQGPNGQYPSSFSGETDSLMILHRDATTGSEPAVSASEPTGLEPVLPVARRSRTRTGKTAPEGKPPAVTLRSRYGVYREIRNVRLLKGAVRELVDELCEEQFDRPDYEHCQVSVSQPGGWSISAEVRGEVELTGPGADRTARRYLNGLPKTKLVSLCLSLAKGEIARVLKENWSERPLPAAERGDHYLLANRKDLTDLHRAAAKGDCEWLRRELDGGADVESRDKWGATALHFAAIAGHRKACRVLLDAGADPEAETRDGSSPAEYAELSDEYVSPEEAERIVRLLNRKRPSKQPPRPKSPESLSQPRPRRRRTPHRTPRKARLPR